MFIVNFMVWKDDEVGEIIGGEGQRSFGCENGGGHESLKGVVWVGVLKVLMNFSIFLDRRNPWQILRFFNGFDIHVWNCLIC